MRTELFPEPSPVITRRWYLGLGFLIVLAWSLLAAWQRSPYAELLGHEALEDSSTPPSLHLAAFLPSWLLMTAAMMLPVNLSMLIHLIQPGQQAFRRQRKAGGLVGLLGLGYLLPWAVFGLLAYLGDSHLHELAEPGAPLSALSGWIAPGVVLFAGFYQLTPLKRQTLARCHSPHALAPQNAGQVLGSTGAIKQGLRLGLFCVGSCGPLMLLLFALGLHRLDLMLVLAGVLAIERLAPWGERLTALVGFVLLAWGMAYIVL